MAFKKFMPKRLSNKQNLITPETTLEEILKMDGSEKVFREFSLPCLDCPFLRMEMSRLMIGDVAKMYGIDIKKMLDKLNALDEGKKTKSDQYNHQSTIFK